jgi:hypothetical protein
VIALPPSQAFIAWFYRCRSCTSDLRPTQQAIDRLGIADRAKPLPSGAAKIRTLCFGSATAHCKGFCSHQGRAIRAGGLKIIKQLQLVTVGYGCLARNLTRSLQAGRNAAVTL